MTSKSKMALSENQQGSVPLLGGVLSKFEVTWPNFFHVLSSGNQNVMDACMHAWGYGQTDGWTNSPKYIGTEGQGKRISSPTGGVQQLKKPQAQLRTMKQSAVSSLDT